MTLKSVQLSTNASGLAVRLNSYVRALYQYIRYQTRLQDRELPLPLPSVKCNDTYWNRDGHCLRVADNPL